MTETGVRASYPAMSLFEFVLTLYSIPAQAASTYAEMMRTNARALAEGLGGG